MVAGGLGGPRDEAAGLGFAIRGCQGGSGLGCYGAGVAHASGLGAKKDLATAASYFERGCEKGSDAACDALAKLGR